MDKELRFSYRVATAHTSLTIAASFLGFRGFSFGRVPGFRGVGVVVGVVSVGVT